MNREISPHIFRAYDIRGLYQKDVYPELFYKIGLATGAYLKSEHNGKNILKNPGKLSSKILSIFKTNTLLT